MYTRADAHAFASRRYICAQLPLISTPTAKSKSSQLNATEKSNRSSLSPSHNNSRFLFPSAITRSRMPLFAFPIITLFCTCFCRPNLSMVGVCVGSGTGWVTGWQMQGPHHLMLSQALIVHNAQVSLLFFYNLQKKICRRSGHLTSLKENTSVWTRRQREKL